MSRNLIPDKSRLSDALCCREAGNVENILLIVRCALTNRCRSSLWPNSDLCQRVGCQWDGYWQAEKGSRLPLTGDAGCRCLRPVDVAHDCDLDAVRVQCVVLNSK